MSQPETLRLTVTAAQAVSAMLEAPPAPVACAVMAHGAGAGMTHPFMTALSSGLAARGVATLRFQFPFMERGSRRPDSPAAAHATIRAAVAEAASRFPTLPLIAGGKSFGARMTSQAQALAPMHAVTSLAFFGFPLHPAGKPSVARAVHLAEIRVPMLFIQGTRDALAEVTLLAPMVAGLGPRASLVLIEAADHAFHAPARAGRTDAQRLDEALDAFAAWTRSTPALAVPSPRNTAVRAP